MSGWRSWLPGPAVTRRTLAVAILALAVGVATDLAATATALWLQGAVYGPPGGSEPPTVPDVRSYFIASAALVFVARLVTIAAGAWVWLRLGILAEGTHAVGWLLVAIGGLVVGLSIVPVLWLDGSGGGIDVLGVNAVTILDGGGLRTVAAMLIVGGILQLLRAR